MNKYTVESPKQTLREADNPLKRTNLVARIEFSKDVIREADSSDFEQRVLMQNYLQITDIQKLQPIIFMDITKFA